MLPVYVGVSKHNPVLQTLSGPAVLLVWLYVMANVIVLGAEVNWWRARRAQRGRRRERAERLRGERAVRVLGLPGVAELRDGARLARGTKSGSKPKPPPGRRSRDRALEHAGAAELARRPGRSRRARRRTARAGSRSPASAASSFSTCRPSAQRAGLHARVRRRARRPRSRSRRASIQRRPGRRAAEPRLDPRVVDVRRAVLRRVASASSSSSSQPGSSARNSPACAGSPSRARRTSPAPLHADHEVERPRAARRAARRRRRARAYDAPVALVARPRSDATSLELAEQRRATLPRSSSTTSALLLRPTGRSC